MLPRMRGWLLAAVTLAGCSPFEGIARDRATDLATIAAHPPAERAPELRDRLLRDALDGRIRSVKGWETLQDPAVAALATRVPLTLAEDYVALGDALAGAGDRDGALAAYDDALVVTARAGHDPGHGAVRQAALRGSAAAWKALGYEERGRAAAILADASALHPAPADWAAFVVGSAARADSPGLKRLAAPALAASGSAPLEIFVTTELGGREAALVAEGLDLMRSGAPARQLETVSARLAALAPPPAPPPLVTPPPPVTPPSPLDPPPPPAAPAPGKGDVATRLKNLDDLHSQKLITDAEYARERARILREAL